MKLLLEASLPSHYVSSLSRPNWVLVPFTDQSATDGELVEVAAATNCNAVVFLGPHALGRPELLRAAEQYAVALIATETYNPIDAIEYIRDNLGRLEKVLPGSHAFLLQRDRVVSLSLDDLLVRRLGHIP